MLVEDDQNLGYILSEYLIMHDHEVTWAKDGEEGLEAFGKSTFELCILDIMMPKMDGFSLAEKIKSINPEVPLIFLTAKALKVDKLKGFKLGADDYLVKPVDEEELIARIGAVLKRSQPAHSRSMYTISSYTFNVADQTLTRNGTKQIITTKEAQVLQHLCINKGHLTDRNDVLRAAWGESDYFNRRSMDVFISKLRKYLSEDSNIKITNVHGKGFVLEC